MPIEVTAMQFAFLFHYPDGDIISGELHVPVDRPVSLKMEAKDVIHAFWIPEFRIANSFKLQNHSLVSATYQF